MTYKDARNAFHSQMYTASKLRTGNVYTIRIISYPRSMRQQTSFQGEIDEAQDEVALLEQKFRKLQGSIGKK